MKALAEYDLTEKPRLDRARDLFLVGCWTGLRFSDFNDIRPKNIKGDFIEIKTQKTGETVVIPIHSALKNIMEKYAGKTENSLPPSISNDKLNEYITHRGSGVFACFPGIKKGSYIGEALFNTL